MGLIKICDYLRVDTRTKTTARTDLLPSSGTTAMKCSELFLSELLLLTHKPQLSKRSCTVNETIFHFSLGLPTFRCPLVRSSVEVRNGCLWLAFSLVVH